MSTTTATTTAVRTLQIDKAHSEIGFQVRHLLSKVRGRFSDFSGTIEFDEEQPERSSVEFTAQVASIDTNNADRDAHLRTDDFFSAEKFPTLTFRSRRITKAAQERFEVEGDLSIRGVTKTIVVPVDYLGQAKDPWGNLKVGFEAEVTIDRKDFGLSYNAALEAGGFLIGDDVKIHIVLQAA
jgi:polyisoprenoid-binding protein YceI